MCIAEAVLLLALGYPFSPLSSTNFFIYKNVTVFCGNVQSIKWNKLLLFICFDVFCDLFFFLSHFSICKYTCKFGKYSFIDGHRCKTRSEWCQKSLLMCLLVVESSGSTGNNGCSAWLMGLQQIEASSRYLAVSVTFSICVPMQGLRAADRRRGVRVAVNALCIWHSQKRDCFYVNDWLFGGCRTWVVVYFK